MTAIAHCLHCSWCASLTGDDGADVGSSLLKIVLAHTALHHPGRKPRITLDSLTGEAVRV